MIDDVVKQIEMEDAQSKQDAINEIESHRVFIGNRDTYNQQRFVTHTLLILYDSFITHTV